MKKLDIKVAPGAKKWLEEWLRQEHVGVEFGSGMSTPWLGNRVKRLISVEHNPGWLNKVKDALEEHDVNNVDLVYQPNLKVYPNIIGRMKNRSLDFVFVDGRERVKCIRGVIPKIKQGGIIILDDAERKRYSEAYFILKDWKLDYFESGRRDTAIWTKKK